MLQDSPGNTYVAALKNHHVDVRDLNTERFVVRLARLLQASVQDGNHRKINGNRLRQSAVDGHTRRPLAG